MLIKIQEVTGQSELVFIPFQFTVIIATASMVLLPEKFLLCLS